VEERPFMAAWDAFWVEQRFQRCIVWLPPIPVIPKLGAFQPSEGSRVEWHSSTAGPPAARRTEAIPSQIPRPAGESAGTSG